MNHAPIAVPTLITTHPPRPVLPQHLGKMKQRIAKMTMLIEALSFRSLAFDDVCELLGYSPSGARKYLTELSKFNVIERASEHERVFKLTDDLDARKAFMSRLSLGMSQGLPKPAKSDGAIRTALASTGRHFHLMMDDAPFKIKPSKKIPAADPLLAMFYGRA